MEIYKHTCNKVNNYSCLTGLLLNPNLTCMTLGKRLKLARKHAKLTQSELADKLEGLMTQQNISLLEKEITTGTEYIVQLALVCGVKPEWLAMGQGLMTDIAEDSHTPEYQVVLAMRGMNQPTKHQLVKISHSLVEPKASNGENSPD